jgi:Flp pilus assembly protein TadG
MLPPLIERPLQRARNRRERGITLALVALAIFSIIAMAGLSIDVGTLYEASAEAQRVADAAALAGARSISISGITGAATPATDTSSWQQICGGINSVATESAVAVAQRDTVGGATVPSGSITVTYSVGNSASAGNTDCSTLAAGFGVNPVVTVKVTQSSLPTYFSRIWGRSGSSVSATASAEVFNPSNSGTYSSNGDLIPVQPRCVKPLIIPNIDPTSASASPFVSPSTGAISNAGISQLGNGVIGESFTLTADCRHGQPNCLPPAPGNLLANPPTSAGGIVQYLPALVQGTPVAVSSCATADTFQEAIAGCDQSTVYTCGTPAGSGTQVDLTENPVNPHSRTGDTGTALQCLIHAGGQGAGNGQDQLNDTTFPFQIQAGSSNPLVADGLIPNNSIITSSSSIVTLPIYDGTKLAAGTQPQVTIVGFLQVFVQYLDGNGHPYVTLLNVAGCGNGQTTTVSSNPVFGTSPVPIRLITLP